MGFIVRCASFRTFSSSSNPIPQVNRPSLILSTPVLKSSVKSSIQIFFIEVYPDVGADVLVFEVALFKAEAICWMLVASRLTVELCAAGVGVLGTVSTVSPDAEAATRYE